MVNVVNVVNVRSPRGVAVEVGAEILLRIARELGRATKWLLTGDRT